MVKTSQLSRKLKYRTTVVLSEEPSTCPTCHCPRFSLKKLTALDKTLGRKNRFQCDKCKVVTLQVVDSPLSNMPESSAAHDRYATVCPDSDELAKQKFDLAIQYAHGNGLPADLGAAFTLFSQAAGLGHAKAQFNVAVFFLKGHVVTKDLQQALKWMERSAQQDHYKAKLALPKLAEIASK